MGAAWTIGLVLAAALLLAGCMRPPALTAPAGATLTPLRTISKLEARVLLRLSGVKGMPLAHAVNLYRMEYADARGGRLSGLLALPRGVAPGRVVSFQHGTATTRSAVPSKPDGTGLAAAILFAGNGYTLVAPDYPGMGISPGKHPYYVAEVIGPAVAGLITAAQEVEGVPDTPVFLSGFSEGGWASLAGLGVLEAQGTPVLGSAQVAGAYDLRRVSLPAAMKGGAASHSLYLAYAAWGQAAHYGHRLDSVLTPESAALAERLFAGAKPKEILASLPAQPRAMFNADFLRAFDTDGSHWMLESFAANSLTHMTPRAPLRLYYGSADADVVPAEALRAAEAMGARGAAVTAVDVGPVGHDASMLAAAPGILAWLRELEAAP
ncbi:lipase family protein [Phenylobacterium sp.]|uniref:alpha/beta hydrolase family protein n=1 Tax=Phenylobacterium sp. TaxID=1871053 RepID=UPI0030F49FA1